MIISKNNSRAKHSSTRRLARYCRTAIAATLVSTGTLSYTLPALADGTTAGTQIRNTAVGSFQNATIPSETGTVTSNEVTVTVAEVAGITATSTGTPTEAPAGVNGGGPTQGDGDINPGDVVYYTFTVTNTGNDPTQFFVPGAPSDIQRNNISGGAVLAGNVEIIGYDADGSTPVDLSTTPVAVLAGGQATGDLASLGSGSFAPGGSITVRVPVQLDSNLAQGDVIKVILGNVDSNDNSSATQNQDYVSDGNDLYTQDNAGIANDDIDGAPINGDVDNNRKEASAAEEVVVELAARDYGDLPAPYASTEAVGGPSHFIRDDGTNPDLFLGSGVEAESDAEIANGDATDDAEDDALNITSGGATASFQGLSFIQGETITLDDVSATGSGHLSLWIDWDGDGLFNGTNEAIAADLTPDAAGNITIPDITVPTTATAGTKGVLVRYAESTGIGPTAVGGYGEVETYQINVGDSQADLILIKRVTSVGGVAIDSVIDDPNTTDDNNPFWAPDYLKGSIDTSTAKPGDEIEYTVYFLSSGNDSIANLNICDMIPEETTYNDTIDSIQLSFNNTITDITNDINDGQGGFDPNGPSGAGIICPNVSSTHTKGGVLVKVVEGTDVVANATGQATPDNSYGWIRFKVMVD